MRYVWLWILVGRASLQSCFSRCVPSVFTTLTRKSTPVFRVDSACISWASLLVVLVSLMMSAVCVSWKSTIRSPSEKRESILTRFSALVIWFLWAMMM